MLNYIKLTILHGPQSLHPPLWSSTWRVISEIVTSSPCNFCESLSPIDRVSGLTPGTPGSPEPSEAMGLQLQELYVAPRHMTSKAWDILAEGLKWSRRNAEVLRDSHWAFGDVSNQEVYCDLENRGTRTLYNIRFLK